MSNLIINLKWKKTATAADMTDVLRECRGKGWRVVTMLGLWVIYAFPVGEQDT